MLNFSMEIVHIFGKCPLKILLRSAPKKISHQEQTSSLRGREVTTLCQLINQVHDEKVPYKAFGFLGYLNDWSLGRHPEVFLETGGGV